MILRKGNLFVGFALSLVLISSQAQAHWCDDLWASSYNIVVKPESDTVTAGTPMKIYVQNNMGYQLISFKLSASVGGTALTSTPPTTLKVAGTLLPGEKGIWTISGTGLTKIEDVTFSVSFGNSGESKCYPTKGANAVMVVKTDGTLYPAAPPAGLDTSGNPGNGCTGDVTQARSLQYEAMADFENVGTGLDKLMTLYCTGRASWGSTDGVTPSMCPSPTTNPASCPNSKPASGTGSKYDYMHLWAAGELAARKSALGARLPILRFRLQCGANDGDTGFAGYAMIMLGYLGQDATAQAYLQTQSSAAGDLGTIAKAALYLMGDTTQKAAVQTGAQSGGAFAKPACAAALGIVDKDDATVSSALIPQVQWTEPDGGNDGKAMFAAHLLALVAWDRRNWAANGADTGGVTFYGDTATGSGGSSGGTGGVSGTGGATGAGGATGNKDAGVGSDAKAATGGTSGSGGVSSNGGAVPVGSGGAGGSGGSKSGAGGAIGAGGTTGPGGTIVYGGAMVYGGVTNAGGAPSAGGASAAGGNTSPGGSKSSGGSTGSAGGSSGGSLGAGGDTGNGSASTDSNGCKCNLGAHAQAAPTMSMYILFMAGMAWIAGRRRRR